MEPRIRILLFLVGMEHCQKRILSDYQLGVDQDFLNRKEAACIMYPHKLVRNWKQAQETFYLVDDRPVLYIGMDQVEGDSIAIRLNQDLLQGGQMQDEGIAYGLAEDSGHQILLAPAKDCDFRG